MTSPQPWVFIDPQDLAVVSLRRIFENDGTVRFVSHDADGSWQFLDGDDFTEKDGVVVGLGEVVELDPTLVQVAALPRGWYAVREEMNTPWFVAPDGMSIADYYESLPTDEDEDGDEDGDEKR